MTAIHLYLTTLRYMRCMRSYSPCPEHAWHVTIHVLLAVVIVLLASCFSGYPHAGRNAGTLRLTLVQRMILPSACQIYCQLRRRRVGGEPDRPRSVLGRRWVT